MRQISLAAALVAAFTTTGVALAIDTGTAQGTYNFVTGEIIVSVMNVSNWYVESESRSMTGPDDVSAILPLAGGLISNNPVRVGELLFGGDFSYADVNLGAIALPHLIEGDLNIFWNAAGAGPQPTESQAVVYVPEPITLLLGTFAAWGLLVRRRC